MRLSPAVAVLLSAATTTHAFTSSSSSLSLPTKVASPSLSRSYSTAEATAETTDAAAAMTDAEALRQAKKRELLGLIGAPPSRSASSSSAAAAAVYYDPILADPITKAPLSIGRVGGSRVVFGDQTSSVSRGSKVTLTSADSETTYSGRTDTYYNLLEADEDDSRSTSTDDESAESSTTNASSLASNLVTTLTPLIPPPLRFALKATGLADDDYVPMRDLFTNPSVSFAYERGWRQGFAAAGFPGPDREAQMVQEYFEPVTVVVGGGKSTVVDMSCATGLFTRRLTKSGEYDRVIGCDYSDSMLSEARRRINADPELRKRTAGQTKLDLVRCDVGKIPMQTDSVDALHAGAAMHCWPDLDAALSEIYRVLKPGGRYFASTFLAQYFRGVQASENGQTGPNVQAFQYFASTDELKEMLVKAGFEGEKVSVEVLGTACVIIKAEK